MTKGAVGFWEEAEALAPAFVDSIEVDQII